MTDDNLDDVQLEETVYMKKAEWNKAIEAAVRVAIAERHNREMADQIRKLKK